MTTVRLIKMTIARQQAYAWLKAHNGDGLFDKNGVLVAGGERAPFTRSTWNALRDAGLVEFYNKRRVRILTSKTYEAK